MTALRAPMIILLTVVCVFSQERTKAIKQIRAPDLSLGTKSASRRSSASQFTHRSDNVFSQSNRQEAEIKQHRLPLVPHQAHPFTPSKRIPHEEVQEHNRKVRNPQVVYSQPNDNHSPETHHHKVKHQKINQPPSLQQNAPGPVKKTRVPTHQILVQPEAITSEELELRNLNDPSVVEIREIIPPIMTKYNEDGSLFTPTLAKPPHKSALSAGIRGHKLPARGKIPGLPLKRRKNRRPIYPIPGRKPSIVKHRPSNINFRDQGKTQTNLPHTFIPRSGHIDRSTIPRRINSPDERKRSIDNFGHINFNRKPQQNQQRHNSDHTRLEIGDSDEVYVLRVPEDVLAKKQNTDKPYAMLLTAPSESSQETHQAPPIDKKKDKKSWWQSLPFIKNFAKDRSSDYHNENLVSASEIKNSFLPPPNHDTPHDPYLSKDVDGNYYYPTPGHAGQAAFESVPDILKPILNPIRRLVVPDEFRSPFRGGYAPYRPGYQYQYHVPYYPAPYNPSIYSAKKRASHNVKARVKNKVPKHRIKTIPDHIEDKTFKVTEEDDYVNKGAESIPENKDGITIIDTGTHYAVIQGDANDYIKFQRRIMRGETEEKSPSKIVIRRMDDDRNHGSDTKSDEKIQTNKNDHKKELFNKYGILYESQKNNSENTMILAEAIAKKTADKPKSRSKRQLRTNFRRRRRYQNLPITRRSNIQTNYPNSANARLNQVEQINWESVRHHPRRNAQQQRRKISPRGKLNNFNELPNGQVVVTRQFTNLIVPKVQLSAPYHAPKNILEVPRRVEENAQSVQERDDRSDGIQFGFQPLQNQLDNKNNDKPKFEIDKGTPPSVITISTLTQTSADQQKQPNSFGEVTFKSKIEDRATTINSQHKVHDEQNKILPNPLRTESGFKPMTEFHGLPQDNEELQLPSVNSVSPERKVPNMSIVSTTVEPIADTFLPTEPSERFEPVRYSTPNLSEAPITDIIPSQNELEAEKLRAESSVLHSTVSRHGSSLTTNSVVQPEVFNSVATDGKAETKLDAELKSKQQTHSDKPESHLDIFNAEIPNKRQIVRRKKFNRERTGDNANRPTRPKVVRVTRVRNGARRQSVNGRRKNRFRRPSIFSTVPNSQQPKQNRSQTHFNQAATHRPVLFGSKLTENHFPEEQSSDKIISTTAEPLDADIDHQPTTLPATTTNKPKTNKVNWVQVMDDIKILPHVDTKHSSEDQIAKNEVFHEILDGRPPENLTPEFSSVPSTTEQPITTSVQTTTQSQKSTTTIIAHQDVRSDNTVKPAVDYNYVLSRKRPSTLSKTYNVFNNRRYPQKRISKTRYKIPTLPPTATSDDESPHVQLQKYLNRYAEKYGLNRVNKTKQYPSLGSTSMPAAGLRWSSLKEETNNYEQRNPISTPPSRIFDRQEWTQLLFEDNKVPSASQFSYRFQPPPSTFVRPKVKVPRLAALLNRSRSKSVTRTVTVPITERITSSQSDLTTERTTISNPIIEHMVPQRPPLRPSTEKTFDKDSKDIFLILNDSPVIEYDDIVEKYPTPTNSHQNHREYVSLQDSGIFDRPVNDFFPIKNSAEFSSADTDEPEGQSSVFSVVYTKEKPQEVIQPEIYTRLNKLLEDNGEKPLETLRLFTVTKTEPPSTLPQQEEILSDDGTLIVQAKPPGIINGYPTSAFERPGPNPSTDQEIEPITDRINSQILDEVVYFKPVVAKVEQLTEASVTHETTSPQTREFPVTTDSTTSTSASASTWTPLKAFPMETSDEPGSRPVTSRAIVAPVRESRSNDGAFPFCLHGSCSLIYEPGRNIRVQH